LNPQYTTEEVIGSVDANGYEPVLTNWKWIGNRIITYYDENEIDIGGIRQTFTGAHFGAVPQTSPASTQPWEWLNCPTAPANGLGTYDPVQENAHVQFAAIDDQLFGICRGEFWRNDNETGRQLNQILHYRADGTFLGEFGLPRVAGVIPNAPGAANNLFVLSVVKVNGVIYVYTTEENCRGVHRWKINFD
jgi:hypothetical protein